MRQLGPRLPVPPPVETDGETPSELLPHERDSLEDEEPFRVEVYRLERKPIDPKPVDRLQEAEAAQAHPPAGSQIPDPQVASEKEEAKEEVEEVNDAAAPAGSGPELRPHERYPVEVREPVEVHRIELNPVETGPAPRLQRAPVATETYLEATSPAAAPEATKELREDPKEAAAPLGRWEEFHEPGRLERVRGDRIHMEPVPLQQGFSSRLLTADLEREPRSPLVILAVLGIAAVLAVGAVLGSSWLRTRVKQQDAAMSALQEQNRKLADTLAQMSAKPPTGATSAPQNSALSQEPKSAQGEHPTQSGHSALPVSGPGQSEGLQGVSVPPPIQSRVHGQRRFSMPQKGSLYDRPPEIVPPYPTLAQPENAGAQAASTHPAPNAAAYRAPFTPGAYQQPVPAARADHPGMSLGTTSRTAVPPAPATSNNTPVPTSSNATQYDAGIGSYANLLAQNIETVEGLQRHSPVQLREFHARAGVPTQATRTVRLSVQHPDQASGSYALLVNEGGSSYQLRGEVNVPLAFTDTATHRQYGLVVLSIAGQQVYGYLRAMQ